MTKNILNTEDISDMSVSAFALFGNPQFNYYCYYLCFAYTSGTLCKGKGLPLVSNELSAV